MNDWLTTLSAELPPAIDAALQQPHWSTIVGMVGLIALGLVGREPTTQSGSWPWPITGVTLGAVGLLAWVSGSVAGQEWELSITGPSRSLIEGTILGTPRALGWGTALVVGIPLGTWLSARARGPVRWRMPARSELGRRFAGGVLMGVGGTLAAGCNIGNALTGLSVLAVNSLIASAAILGGAAIAIAWPGIRELSLGLPLVRKQR
jgi:hypothetical protein